MPFTNRRPKRWHCRIRDCLTRCSYAQASRHLDVGGIPLGLFPDSQYEETSLQLHTGDVLVFYSDGVIEMRNDTGEEFGLRRLAEIVRTNHEKTPEEIVKSVSAALAEFIGRVRPNDDRTMIVVKMGESI